MIVDALADFDPDVLEADLCIIGAGAAGITIARACLGTRLRVCVLESGGFDPDQVTQSLYEGENVGLDYFPLDATRLRFFGGTTNHWGGMCAPLSPIDFRERPWVPLSGWPFGPDELEPYYRRAHEFCEIASDDYRPGRLEELLGARRLGLDSNLFETTVIRYSPPTRFGETYRSTLEGAGNVVVLLNANALEIETNEGADRAQRIRCATTARKAFHIAARAFVLAAGGIENPRLLLLSNSVQPSGLGNGHDQVGRCFMEHPHRHVGVLAPEPDGLDVAMYDGARWRRRDGIRASAFLAPSARLQEEQGLLNGSISLEPHYAKEEGLLADAESFIDRVGRAVARRGVIDHRTYRTFFERQDPLDYLDVACAWEQSPNPDSRVGLSNERDLFGQPRVRLDWRIARADEEALERSFRLFAQELGRAGIGRLQLDIRVEGWPGGHHHMGTTRMHASPRLGVVDPDCRLHGVDNLYVAGSSVFPTSGGVNPTLTIVALALRLADRLKAELA